MTDSTHKEIRCKVIAEGLQSLEVARHPLGSMLSVAVPLWVEELALRPMTDLRDIAMQSNDVLQSTGEAILFSVKKKGDSAAAFNALAKGVAAMSFCPGGVSCFGMRFESTHPETEAALLLKHTIDLPALEEEEPVA